MTRRCLILLAALIASLSTAAPRVSRGVLAELERRFDVQIKTYSIDDPFGLLGTTRGVYLDDYGVVFTSELNLVAAAALTPFSPRVTEEYKKNLRAKKLRRLELLRDMMRSMMVDSALRLNTVPAEQKVAVGVTIFRFSWEDSRGLPAQILMETQRQTLLDFENGALDGDGLKAAIRVEEF